MGAGCDPQSWSSRSRAPSIPRIPASGRTPTPEFLKLADPKAAPPDLFGLNPQLPPFPGHNYETPASLACVYGLVAKTAGCNPRTLKTNATGGSKVVAIVDAFDDPTVLSDLKKYSKQFGLPAITAANFQVVYASGSRPAYNAGWAQEEGLDVEMAHALAPKAKVILVEAASNSFADLANAEVVAQTPWLPLAVAR